MAYSHTPSELPKAGPERERGLPEGTQHAQGPGQGWRPADTCEPRAGARPGVISAGMREGLPQALTRTAVAQQTFLGHHGVKPRQDTRAEGNLLTALMGKLRLAGGGDLPRWTSGPGWDWTAMAPAQACSSGPHCPGLLQGGLQPLRCLEHEVTGKGCQGVPSVSGIQLVQTPLGSLSSQDDPRAASTREGENTGRSARSTWGDPTTPFCGPRGQGAHPRSKSQCSGTGNPGDAFLGRFRFGGAGPESWLLGGDLLRCDEL